MHVINRCTEYAVLSLLHMAARKDIVSALELADTLSIPHPFLRNILRTLKQNRIIGSRRGQKGGFVLEKKADTISLLEILTIFQGPFQLAECAGTDTCSRALSCTLRPELEPIEKDLLGKLESTTVQSLLNRHKK